MDAHERIGGQTEADTEKCLRLQKSADRIFFRVSLQFLFL